MFQILPDLPSILAVTKKHPKRLWGWRIHPIHGTKKWHNGVDLSCKTGTPILAPWRGIVHKKWSDKLNGNALKLRHPYHPTVIETAYAHLSAFPSHWSDNESVEQIWVEPGEIIGYVGSTGGSTGPHLHFVIRTWKKQNVEGVFRSDTDPLPYLEHSLVSSS